LLDGIGVFFPNVVSPHFRFPGLREVRREQATYGPTTNYADLH
jgi:hypothetical protein